MKKHEGKNHINDIYVVDLDNYFCIFFYISYIFFELKIDNIRRSEILGSINSKHKNRMF